jgi:hypothetical protein
MRFSILPFSPSEQHTTEDNPNSSDGEIAIVIPENILEIIVSFLFLIMIPDFLFTIKILKLEVSGSYKRVSIINEVQIIYGDQYTHLS